MHIVAKQTRPSSADLLSWVGPGVVDTHGLCQLLARQEGAVGHRHSRDCLHRHVVLAELGLVRFVGRPTKFAQAAARLRALRGRKKCLLITFAGVV